MFQFTSKKAAKCLEIKREYMSPAANLSTGMLPNVSLSAFDAHAMPMVSNVDAQVFRKL